MFDEVKHCQSNVIDMVQNGKIRVKSYQYKLEFKGSKLSKMRFIIHFWLSILSGKYDQQGLKISPTQQPTELYQ